MSEELLGFKRTDAKLITYKNKTATYEVDYSLCFSVVEKKEHDSLLESLKQSETLRRNAEQQLAEEKIHSKNLNLVGDNLAKQVTKKDKQIAELKRLVTPRVFRMVMKSEPEKQENQKEAVR